MTKSLGKRVVVVVGSGRSVRTEGRGHQVTVSQSHDLRNDIIPETFNIDKYPFDRESGERRNYAR